MGPVVSKGVQLTATQQSASLLPEGVTSPLGDTSMLPASLLSSASTHETLEQARISGVEGVVNRLALMMETFLTQHQPTPVQSVSHSSMLLPGTTHPKHARVSLQRK